MADTSVTDVQMIWDRNPPQGEPAVKVYRARGGDDDRYSSNWSIETERPTRTGKETDVQLLLEQFVHLVIGDGLKPGAVHEAFMEIPEYRAVLAEKGTIDPSSA